jgi:hypothetical protein
VGLQFGTNISERQTLVLTTNPHSATTHKTTTDIVYPVYPEMAEACVDHCQLVAFHQDQEDMGQQIENFTVDAVMRGLHYTATHSYVELLAAVYSIKDFLQQKSQVFVIYRIFSNTVAAEQVTHPIFQEVKC